ncbi:MAG: CPBP family intramembrane metalloprotease [Candidatus Aminicenantes bacterium]|nr:CPBP family intramembrane metalloprotease [Candidatus Aminicenantes bacterium]
MPDSATGSSGGASDDSTAVDGKHARRDAAVDCAVVIAFLVVFFIIVFCVTERYAGPITASCAVVLTTFLLRRRGMRWRDVGLRRPSRLRRLLVQVPVVTVTWLAVSAGATILIEKFLPKPDTSVRFGDLAGNLPATLWWIAIAWLIGGFSEEMIFRGFLLRRLEVLLPRGTGRTVTAVFLQAVLFGAMHAYNRGLFGFLALGAVGAVLGTFYIVFGRNLWPVILAHGLGNTLGFIARYLGPG